MSKERAQIVADFARSAGCKVSAELAPAFIAGKERVLTESPEKTGPLCYVAEPTGYRSGNAGIVAISRTRAEFLTQGCHGLVRIQPQSLLMMQRFGEMRVWEMNSSVTFCDICGYTIKGCFYNCKNCGNREVKYYDGFFNEDLMSAYRRLSGARPGGSTLTSLALVAAIVTVSITIYAAHTQHPSVKLAGSVVSGAAEQVDSFASVHCPELSHQLAGGSSKLPQGMLGIIGKTF